MKKNGFTLAELLGVIVILALLMLLVFPAITRQLKEGETNIDQAVEQLILNSAKRYVESNKNEFQDKNTTYCITLNTLVNAGEIKETLLIDRKGKTLDLNKKVEFKIENGKKTYQLNDQCTNQ